MIKDFFSCFCQTSYKGCARIWENLFPFSYRPSKCPKLYTNRILGKQNLRQEMRKYCQNSNFNQMKHLIKHTLRVEFSIKYYTRELHNNNL